MSLRGASNELHGLYCRSVGLCYHRGFSSNCYQVWILFFRSHMADFSCLGHPLDYRLIVCRKYYLCGYPRNSWMFLSLVDWWAEGANRAGQKRLVSQKPEAWKLLRNCKLFFYLSPPTLCWYTKRIMDDPLPRRCFWRCAWTPPLVRLLPWLFFPLLTFGLAEVKIS